MPKRKNRKAKVKERKITPTLKQQIAVKKLSEIVRKSGGQKKITMGRILREAGYSKSASEKPKRVTESQGFKKLLEKHLPDGVIADAHGGALVAEKIDHYNFPLNVSNKVIRETVEKGFGLRVKKIVATGTFKRAYFSVPDHPMRMVAVKEAYKIKDKYPEGEKGGGEGEIEVIRVGVWKVEKGDRDRD